jgi:preprotein translocase subunit SecD
VAREGPPLVVVQFTEIGKLILGGMTGRFVGYPLGIFVDNRLLAGPRILEAIVTGQIVIAGQTLRDADILAAQLNAGVLPVPIKTIESPQG